MNPDRIEVYEVTRRPKRSKPPVSLGWRFRFIKGGNTADALLSSNGLYPTEEAAQEIALTMNRACFRGHYEPTWEVSCTPEADPAAESITLTG